MSFLRRLFGAGGNPAATEQGDETADVLWLYVECEKCGERLRIRVNKRNDLSDAADTSDDIMDKGPENSPPSSYVLHKEILGNNCPRMMHVRASFDGRRRLQEISGQGCRLLTRAAYEASDSQSTS